MMNFIFRLGLRYYNGSFICKTSLLRSVPLYCRGMAIYSEAKVRLIKSGSSFIEVPFEHIGRKYGVSKAVSLNSVIDTLATVLVLVKDIYLPH